MDEFILKGKMKGPNQHPGSHDQHQTRPRSIEPTTHNQPVVLIIHRPLLGHLSKRSNFGDNGRISFAFIHLIVDDGVPDIVRHCGRGLDIVFTFLVVLGIDEIVERIPAIPNQPESTRRELTQ